MKIHKLLLILLIICSHVAFAQKREVDSLEYSLKNAKEDTNKVLILNQLSWKYLSSEPQKMNKYVMQGLALARKLRFYRGEIMLLNRLGDYYSHQGNYAKSIEYTTQSLKIAERVKDSTGIADAYIMLSIVYQGNLKQTELALRYNLMALQIYERKNIKTGVAATLNLIARIYASTNQKLSLAHQYANKSISIAKELNNDDFLAWCLATKALIYNDEKKLDSALIYIKESTYFYKKANDKGNMVINAILVGNIYNEQKNYVAAINSYRQQIEAIRELNAQGLLKDVYGGLAKSYVLQKQYDSAYKYREQYDNLKDSLLNEETSQKIALIQEAYEVEKKEVQIALLEKEKELIQEEKQATNIIFMLSIFALITVLLLIFRNSQQRSKANKLLKEKNEKIEIQNEELKQSREEIISQRDMVTAQNHKLQEINATKNKFFSIISHDLRSPIGSLRNLLSLIANNRVSPNEYHLFFPKLNSSVISIQDTLDNLLQWAYSQMEGVKSSPAKIDISLIIEDNIVLFTEVAKEKKIKIEHFLYPKTFAFADENQVRLIFRNIIGNALKFTPAGGTITISSEQDDSFIGVFVTDTGVGMTQAQINEVFEGKSFTTKGTNNEKGTGLGLRLCKEMIENNNGKIRVESEIGRGSTFTLYFPLS